MSRIRRSARGEKCLIRLPGICTHNPEETVLAHLNGAGMGRKHPDIFGAYACRACHDAVDSRMRTNYSRDELKLAHLEGVIRTQQALIEKGLLSYG